MTCPMEEEEEEEIDGGAIGERDEYVDEEIF